MSDEPVRILATVTPLPGREADALEVLRTVAAASRREPGNEQYELHGSQAGDRVRFHLLERYRDPGAIEAHRSSEHYRTYRERIAGLLEGPVDVAVLDDPDQLVEGDRP